MTATRKTPCWDLKPAAGRWPFTSAALLTDNSPGFCFPLGVLGHQQDIQFLDPTIWLSFRNIHFRKWKTLLLEITQNGDQGCEKFLRCRIKCGSPFPNIREPKLNVFASLTFTFAGTKKQKSESRQADVPQRYKRCGLDSTHSVIFTCGSLPTRTKQHKHRHTSKHYACPEFHFRWLCS